MLATLNDYRSPNFGSRQPVDDSVAVRHLVFHYTGMRSARDALTRLCDRKAEVSAHYLIDENGAIYALVDEHARAWHAGVAFWQGTRDINSTSIGIELVNPGHEYGYHTFPDAQITALTELATDIMTRHGLNPAAVVGHSDIAPGRKQDPGELFPWPALASHGIGLWPQNAAGTTLPEADIWPALAAIGYAVPGGNGADILDPASAKQDVITAFQRRFRPRRIDGIADPETCASVVAVAALYAR